MENKEKIEKEYQELKNSKFKQAKLPGWRPVSSFRKTTLTFFISGVVFIIVGIILLIVCNKVEEVSIRYDKYCEHFKMEYPNNTCNITFDITDKMEKRIMIYYQLTGFYQNHRRYVKSKNDDQLYGKFKTKAELIDNEDCDPVITNADMNKTRNYNNTLNLDQNDLAIPCGLIAKSFFNDRFYDWTIIKNGEEKPFSPNERNIASKADKEIKFNNYDLSKQWINMTDEHFIVWMRPAGLPTFRKLWARIDDMDLEEGSKVNVKIDDNFEVSSFNGKKHLILTTTNSFGGKNLFIGISYIVLGVISMSFGVVFVLGKYLLERNNQ